ncbi:hypothetical protein BsWGS_08197 [Bradybaena similaris]
MNRIRGNSPESDDSGSDWDTTVAESLIQNGPSKASAAPAFKIDMNNHYGKIASRPRQGYKDMKESNCNGILNGRSPETLASQEISQTKGGSQLMSPPPHMTSFQSVLTDYPLGHDAAPELPPRGYEAKGKLYTVPESDSYSSPQANLAHWDDSDAEERVLKEMQKNLAKDKLRHQTINRDRKVVLTGIDKINASVENSGFIASPKEARSNESVLEKWPRNSDVNFGKIADKNQKCITLAVDSLSQLRPPSRSGMITPPLIAKDPSGKRCVFYFEEGNLHFVEVAEDGVNAYLPAKVDEMEKIFRRVWREVFAVLRIFTSVFVLFVVELILFLAHHIVRLLVLDTITALGNYVLKPLLALIFNAVIQPIFALLWNTFNSMYQASEPLVKLLGYILTQVAILFKAFRLCVVQWNSPAGYRQEMEII